MKMVKSHTRKKFVKPRTEVEAPNKLKQVTSATTDYIKKWTQRELARMQQEESIPICLPTDDGYRIGQYRLKLHKNKTCDVLDHNLEFVHRFEDKISAILYVIYTLKKRYYQADQILGLSTEINKCYADMLNLRWGVDSARKRNDFVAVDNRQARLEIAENRLNIARNKLLQIHRTAKYNKVWE
jgi:hypothetical protein